jgi:hypothetical protein
MESDRGYQNLKQLIEGLGNIFYDEGSYNLNLIFVRTSNIFTNMFSDILYVAYKVDEVENVLMLNATTKASLYGKGGVTNPLPGGTAVIIPNQYKSTWQYNKGDGSGKLPWGVPYLKQVKGIDYYRDANKDNVIDETNIQKNEIFYTNIHAMREPLSVNIPNSLPWTEGCMGADADNFANILDPILQKSIEIWGDLFTGTIIKAY